MLKDLNLTILANSNDQIPSKLLLALEALQFSPHKALWYIHYKTLICRVRVLLVEIRTIRISNKNEALVLLKSWSKVWEVWLLSDHNEIWQDQHQFKIILQKIKVHQHLATFSSWFRQEKDQALLDNHNVEAISNSFKYLLCHQRPITHPIKLVGETQRVKAKEVALLAKINLLPKIAMVVTHEALNEITFSNKCLLLLQIQASLSRLSKRIQSKTLHECSKYWDLQPAKHLLPLSYLSANRMLKHQPVEPLVDSNKVPPPTTEDYSKYLPLKSKMTNLLSKR